MQRIKRVADRSGCPLKAAHEYAPASFTRMKLLSPTPLASDDTGIIIVRLLDN